MNYAVDSDKIERRLLEPVTRFGRGFYAAVIILGLFALWAFIAYVMQLREGLGVTGLGRPVFWGVYMTSFVFFIALSAAGMLVSAILRLSKAEWRRPVTRAAETIAVFGLLLGALQMIFNLGRIGRVWELFIWGRFESPLFWVMIVTVISFFVSLAYLYVPMIPDLALMRDTLSVGRNRKWIYTRLAWGWSGTEQQRRKLDRAIAVLSIIVIPVAIFLITAVSWVFGMTLQPLWHSPTLGLYFVMGAIFLGIAVIIVVMAVLRRVYRLEPFYKPLHFQYLGTLLLVFNCLWFYFTFTRHLTTLYGSVPSNVAVLKSLMTEGFVPWFWLMVIVMAAAFVLLVAPSRKTVGGTTLAALLVILGIWLESFNTIVPALSRPRLAYPLGVYSPSWVEWSLLLGSLAVFILLYVVFSKLFPVISIWEVKKSPEAAEETSRRLDSYHPDPVA